MEILVNSKTFCSFCNDLIAIIRDNTTGLYFCGKCTKSLPKSKTANQKAKRYSGFSKHQEELGGWPRSIK